MVIKCYQVKHTKWHLLAGPYTTDPLFIPFFPRHYFTGTGGRGGGAGFTSTTTSTKDQLATLNMHRAVMHDACILLALWHAFMSISIQRPGHTSEIHLIPRQTHHRNDYNTPITFSSVGAQSDTPKNTPFSADSKFDPRPERKGSNLVWNVAVLVCTLHCYWEWDRPGCSHALSPET